MLTILANNYGLVWVSLGGQRMNIKAFSHAKCADLRRFSLCAHRLGSREKCSV